MFKLFRKNELLIDNNSNNEVNTVISEESRFDIKEAYNELRTNISFSIPKKGCKIICTTSALASEGKTTSTTNVAISFAKNNKKVLLIDCDLRKPSVDKLLKIENTKGTSDFLVSSDEFDALIHKNVYENLDVMTSGNIPPNPVELISSDRMKELIETAGKDYDYIFIDAPPVNVVIDAVLVAQNCDGVMMVVRQGTVDKKMLFEAVKKLKLIEAKIIGFILNDVSSTKGGYSSYKYSYKYQN